jgi:Na+/melibiose symporter-like transporter
MSSIDTPKANQRSGALINRDFALLWAGQWISWIGDSFFDFTLVLWIAFDLGKGKPWAPLAVSAVLITSSLATLLVGPIAGVFVDRWSKRATLRIVMLLQGLCVAFLVPATDILPLPFVPGGTVPLGVKLGMIYPLVFLVFALAQFTRPAQTALIGLIVPEADRGKASGLMQSVSSLSLLVGFVVAPILFVPFGPRWALIIDVFSFVVAFVAISLMTPQNAIVRDDATPQSSWGRDFVAGVRLTSSNRILRTVTVSFVLLMLGAGALNGVYVFFVTENLRAPVASLGAFVGLLGMGIFAGSILGNTIMQRLGAGRMFWLALVMAGFAGIVISRQTALLPALIVLVFLAFPQGLLNVALMPLLLHAAPQAMVGRASSLLNTAVMLAQLLSLATVGLLASTIFHGIHFTFAGLAFGTYDLLILFPSVMAIGAGLYARNGLRGVQLIAKLPAE